MSVDSVDGGRFTSTRRDLEAKQPEESEQEMNERLQKNYEKVYAEKYEQPEESDVSDMEVTDDEEEGLMSN